ncbi:ethanolamine-phosphate cytidylyltransferase, partial [Phakopsora pachyrhizi]
LFHYGHANALRQSKGLADELIVGCHSDLEIQSNKGPTVLTQSERCELLNGCRWVDQVVPDAPYSTQLEFIKPFEIDFVAHGDDITTDSAGLDSYRFVKEAGLYKEFQRTRSISTTDTLSRILSPDRSFTRTLHSTFQAPKLPSSSSSVEGSPGPIEEPSPRFRDGHLLAMVRPPIDLHLKGDKSDELKEAQKNWTIYLHGPFDLFSAEDLKLFEQITENGRFNLLVGIWTNKDIEEKLKQPVVWNFQERALTVLQCKFVTGLVLPAIPSNQLLKKGSEGQSYFTISHSAFGNSRIGDYQSTLRIFELIKRQHQLYLDRQANKLLKAKLESELEKQQP